MSKLHHTIYLTIVGALTAVIVGLLMLTPTEKLSEPLSHRIVVFPVQSMSPDTANIAAELTSALIRLLENAPDTEVILESDLPTGMRNVSEHHLWPKDQMISMIFEGSVARIGDNVRITVQLVDGSSDSHLWAETYNTTSDEIDGISESVKDQVLAIAAR